MRLNDYSYLDLTVMGFLRKRVLSQDAVVVFDGTLTRVVWANAFGVELFAGDNLSALLEQTLVNSHPIVQQIEGAVRQLHAGEMSDGIVRRLRISRGLSTELVQTEIGLETLPNGENVVVVIALHDPNDRRLREYELAQATVETLEDFASASAVLDEYGLIIAASREFEPYDIQVAALEAMVREAAKEADRLVKRPVTLADGRALPAGIGKINDNPARYLIVLADPEAMDAEDERETPGDSAPVGARSHGWSASPRPQQSSGDDVRDTPPWQEDADTDDEATTASMVDTVSGEAISGDRTEDKQKTPGETDTGETDTGETDTGEPATGGTSLLDRWYFDADDKVNAARQRAGISAPPPASTPPVPAPATDVSGEQEGQAEIRFAFLIDRESVVRDVTPELASAVGESAADIAGRRWVDIAASLQMDDDGRIAALLRKADTWSGRTVMWPIEGTDMRVPIDLAALPIYDRQRNFDGFRGFGKIRLQDALIDPDALGLKIGTGEFTYSTAAASAEDTAVDKTADRPVDTLPDETEEPPVVWSGERVEPDAAPQAPPDAQPPDAQPPDAQPNAKRDVDDARPSNVLPMKRSGKEPAERTDAPANDAGKTLSGRDQRNFDTIAETLRASGVKVVAGEEILESVQAHEGTDAADDGDSQQPTGTEHAESDALTGKLALLLINAEMCVASDEFLSMIGYDSVDALEAAGGLDALIGTGNTGDAANHNKGATFLHPKSGEPISVRSTLKRIRWHGRNALLLEFDRFDNELQIDGETSAEAAAQAVNASPTSDTRIENSDLQGILDTAADGIVMIDRNGYIRSVNASGEALFGRKNAELDGLAFANLFNDAGRSEIEDYLKQASGDDKGAISSILHHGREAIVLEPGGGKIPVFVTLGRVGNNGNMCAVLRDLTEWKQTEKALLQARKDAEDASEQKSKFLSQVSHEIREPLTAIIGFSDIMLEERFGPVGSARYKAYLEGINRSGIHVLDLVNDLLDISKIESGKLELEFEAVDLNRIASQTVALLQPKANSKRVILRTSLSGAVPKVVADLRSIRQIFINLIGNAVNHSPANTQVIVSSSLEANGEVAVRVRDNGEGMSKTELAHAMRHRAPLGSRENVESDLAVMGDETADGDTRTALRGGFKKSSGTGLGLPLTRALVEANRAYFDIESEEGTGTVVHIVFPSQRVLAE